VILAQVLRVDQSVVLPHRGDQMFGSLTFVEALGAVLGDALQGLGELGLLQEGPLRKRLAARQEDARRLGPERQDLVLGADRVMQEVADFEALAGQTDRWGEQLGERARAELGVQLAEPLGEPGTPAARAVQREASRTTLPSASRYMSRLAARGARSRKSSASVSPCSCMKTTAKPPPPRLPACGCVTARAKPTATAASTALPPARKTSSPTLLAAGCALTTAPCAPRA
jgi:hypothetical protein